MTAPELQLAEQVPGHPIHSVELALVPAVRARVRILHEPVSFAIAAKWLLAVLALDGIFENIVADSTD